MKHLLAACFLAATLLVSAQQLQKLPRITTVKGELDMLRGHVQGACATDDAIYISYITGIVKLDWNGKVLKHAKLISHSGDCAYYKGKIYIAVAVTRPKPGQPKGQILVLDTELNEVAHHDLDYSTDGITVLDDVLYIGAGPNPKTPHRGNKLARFNIKDDTLNFMGFTDIDHGGETYYGAQDIATDGKYIYVMFYAAKGAKPCAIFDKDLKLVGTNSFGASSGFDFLPPKYAGKNPRCLKVSHTNDWRKQKPGVNPAQVKIDFFELIDGKFVTITEVPKL